jgi:hypothetical protein
MFIFKLFAINIMNGKGEKIYEGGEKYVGYWKDGKRHGKGTMKNQEGTYVGDWKNDKRDGKGAMTDQEGTYVGDWKNGHMEGKGTMNFSWGDIYVGDWKKTYIHGQGTINGQGTMTYQDGGVYKGEWKKRRKNGKGTMNFASGDIYVGNWKNGYINGKGTMTYPDGGVYKGEWKQNRKHGKGTQNYIGIGTYVGNFNYYLLQTKGIMKYVNGDIYKGDWRYEDKHGKGVMTYANGKVYIGEWKHGERHGKGKIIFQNGDIIKGIWTNDTNLQENELIHQINVGIRNQRANMNEQQQQQMLQDRLRQRQGQGNKDSLLSKLTIILTAFNRYNLDKKREFVSMTLQIFDKPKDFIKNKYNTLNKSYIDDMYNVLDGTEEQLNKLELFVHRITDLYQLERDDEERKQQNLARRGNKNPKTVRYNKDGKYEESCPICGDEFKTGDDIVLMHKKDAKHQHIMHKECYGGMSSNKCPMCRGSIEMSFGRIRTVNQVKVVWVGKTVKKKKTLTKALKNQAKKYKVRLTLKCGNKRVYKSEKMLNKQIKNAMKRNK